MLHLGNVLLHYVLIYNLEVSFNLQFKFLQVNVIKMFTVPQTVFFLRLAIFFELQITQTSNDSNSL